jgi:hypothetical protein
MKIGDVKPGYYILYEDILLKTIRQEKIDGKSLVRVYDVFADIAYTLDIEQICDAEKFWIQPYSILKSVVPDSEQVPVMVTDIFMCPKEQVLKVKFGQRMVKAQAHTERPGDYNKNLQLPLDLFSELYGLY